MQPVAIVPHDAPVTSSELALVASAIQIQVVRDLGPAWGIQATCSAFPSLDDVPAGYAIVFVAANANGQAGLHFRPTHPGEPPFALVTYAPDLQWSTAASHEVLELLIDPLGNRFANGPHLLQPGVDVAYLAEVCDPVQDVSLAYQVDHQHPVLVSDFCLPSFYAAGSQSTAYSFRRSVLAPFTVAEGGYLSWREGDGRWFQLRAFGGPVSVVGPMNEHDVMSSAEEPTNFRGDWTDSNSLTPGLPPGRLALVGRRSVTQLFANVQLHYETNATNC